MSIITVRMHLRGNAASMRRRWTIISFIRAFKRSKPFPDTPWDVTTDADHQELYFYAYQPKVVLEAFVSFVDMMVRNGLNGYPHAYIYVNCIDVGDLGQLHSLTVRAIYGAYNTYQILVCAPESVSYLFAHFSFLYGMMEECEHWEVNSVRRFASVPNGVQFDSIEPDAQSVFNHIYENMRNGLQDFLSETFQRNVDRLYIRKYRRNHQFYIRVGIQWDSGQEWGHVWNYFPLDSEHRVVSQQLDDDCCICLQPLRQKNAVEWAPCGHIFHMSCVQQMWSVSTQMDCPLCRAKLTYLRKIVIQPEDCIALRVKRRRRIRLAEGAP